MSWANDVIKRWQRKTPAERARARADAAWELGARLGERHHEAIVRGAARFFRAIADRLDKRAPEK